MMKSRSLHFDQVIAEFERRRQALGLSCTALAGRSGLSLRTVQRILAGEESDPGFATMLSLAEVLGLTLQFEAKDIHGMRREQAEKKARLVVGLVQGTSALESQALAAETLNQLKEQTVAELLAGSPRKLWAD